MATLKERLNRKDSTGTYNTIHMETSSDIVKRDDGTSVEDALTTLSTRVTNLNTTVENVTNNITTEVQTIIKEGNAAHAETHATGGNDELTPAAIGALSTTGTAASATKLATARTFQVNLGSTSTASFDGTSNVTPGVTGTLGLTNGGTGKTTAPLGLYNLVNGCDTLTSDTLVDTDIIPVGDVSAATGKSITIAELKNVLGGGSSSLVDEIPTTPGNVCTWGGYSWTVVHTTTEYIYMILTNIYSTMTFGSTTQYAASNLVTACASFLATMDSKYQDVLAAITVNGVTSKVFVPAHGMVCNDSPAPYSGSDGTLNYKASSQCGDGTTAYPTFSWFNAVMNTNYANRIAYYNGTATYWWTSTARYSSYVWRVDTDGLAYGSTYPSNSYGFRPCVAVKR